MEWKAKGKFKLNEVEQNFIFYSNWPHCLDLKLFIQAVTSLTILKQIEKFHWLYKNELGLEVIE